jgi:hypothetical protein
MLSGFLERAPARPPSLDGRVKFRPGDRRGLYRLRAWRLFGFEVAQRLREIQ